ncbi:CDP-diacylglycerol--serine O-phosphatidyltransferase [soil metagenome]
MIYIPRNFIPSLFTILNAFCGFMSIIQAFNGNFELAAWLIVYASLFDAVDGLAARLTNSASEFGVELDSLSDVISFGAAPSILLYTVYFKSFNEFGILISSLIMVFGAIRLARFNVQLVGFEKDKFSGVPIPMAAITICSYIVYYHNKIFSPIVSERMIIVLAIALPILMVSKFKYDSIPKFSKSAFKQFPVRYIILVLGVIISILTKGEGVFSFCLFYLSTGIVRSTYNYLRKRTRKLKHSIRTSEGDDLDEDDLDAGVEKKR